MINICIHKSVGKISREWLLLLSFDYVFEIIKALARALNRVGCVFGIRLWQSQITHGYCFALFWIRRRWQRVIPEFLVILIAALNRTKLYLNWLAFRSFCSRLRASLLVAKIRGDLVHVCHEIDWTLKTSLCEKFWCLTNTTVSHN